MEENKKDNEAQLSKTLYNDLANMVVECAKTVHETMGSGLLEDIYKKCMAIEMEKQGLHFIADFNMPVVYKTLVIENAVTLDFMVNDLLLVQVKSIDKIEPLHLAQMMTYLKVTNKMRCLLINFNSQNLPKNISSVVSAPYTLLPE